MNWNADDEQKVMILREQGKTYEAIAQILGATATSVKHKVRRLKQSLNEDRYKHTAEKIAEIKAHVPTRFLSHVLETHAGFGCLTEFYADSANEVLALEINQSRVNEIKKMHRESVTAIKCDSENELFSLVYNRLKFTLVDIDPYGLPSRYFPHVFNLIDDGYLLLTFPTTLLIVFSLTPHRKSLIRIRRYQ